MGFNCWTYPWEIWRTQLFECGGGNRIVLDGNFNRLSGTIVGDLQSAHAPDFAHRDVSNQRRENNGDNLPSSSGSKILWPFQCVFLLLFAGKGVVVGGWIATGRGILFVGGHFRSRARLKSDCWAERGRPVLRESGVEACDSRCDWLLARKLFCRNGRRGKITPPE
jgi:hypothetical protein